MGRLTVEYEHDGTTHTQSATRVVNGTGRIAQVEGLNLEAAQVKHDGIRIELDDHLRSVSNPAVWVAGDALLHSAQLSPIATYEGRLVGQNILNGTTVKPEYDAIPSSVYTVPALSSVGLTEQEAEEAGPQHQGGQSRLERLVLKPHLWRDRRVCQDHCGCRQR